MTDITDAECDNAESDRLGCGFDALRELSKEEKNETIPTRKSSKFLARELKDTLKTFELNRRIR